MRVWPWFGRFHEKVFVITRCPLYSMSAIDKFDFRKTWTLMKPKTGWGAPCVCNGFMKRALNRWLINLSDGLFLLICVLDLRLDDMFLIFFFSNYMFRVKSWVCISKNVVFKYTKLAFKISKNLSDGRIVSSRVSPPLPPRLKEKKIPPPLP